MAVALSSNLTSPPAAPAARPEAEAAFVTRELSVWYGQKEAVQKVSLNILSKHITAIIGPSGCGKSTFLRSLNRMHELTPGARTTGEILFRGEDLYSPKVDAATVRRRVGMVFQKSNPFPTMSIAENTVAGLRLNGLKSRGALNEHMEKALRMAALWDEVKDDLHRPGISLSGGQQQRLCIAAPSPWSPRCC